MDQDIELSREEQSNEAINTLLEAATGLDPFGLQWYLRNSTSLSSEMAWDRLGRGHDWMISDVFELAAHWDVLPSTLVSVITEVMAGRRAGDLVAEHDLDRRPYITKAGVPGE